MQISKIAEEAQPATFAVAGVLDAQEVVDAVADGTLAARVRIVVFVAEAPVGSNLPAKVIDEAMLLEVVAQARERAITEVAAPAELPAPFDSLLDTYARKLAANMNHGYEIDARVPSILIAGGSNFPVRKKEKQNAARDSNMQEWQYIQGLLDKIRSTGMGGILYL